MTRPTVPWKELTKAGVASGIVAAGATSIVATIAKSLDVPLEAPRGDEIHIAVVALSTFVGACAGIPTAGVLARISAHPRRDFIATATALTLASFVSPLVFDTDQASKTVLILTHVVAAAIVIPTISFQLNRKTSHQTKSL